MGSDPALLWPYEPLCFRKGTRWDKVCVHLSVLLDLFRASGGYLIHQVNLETSMHKFFLKRNISDSFKAASLTAYRLRIMMSHLRDSKSNSRVVPVRFDSLRCVLDLISLGRPPVVTLDPPENDTAVAHLFRLDRSRNLVRRLVIAS